MPAVLTVTFANLYLVPKLAAILKATGLNADQLPGHLDAYFVVHNFILNHSWIIVLGFVAIVIIPEWLFSSWYRFRRYFLGFIAYLINMMGLMAVTFLAIAAVALATLPAR